MPDQYSPSAQDPNTAFAPLNPEQPIYDVPQTQPMLTSGSGFGSLPRMSQPQGPMMVPNMGPQLQAETPQMGVPMPPSLDQLAAQYVDPSTQPPPQQQGGGLMYPGQMSPQMMQPQAQGGQQSLLASPQMQAQNAAYLQQLQQMQMAALQRQQQELDKQAGGNKGRRIMAGLIGAAGAFAGRAGMSGTQGLQEQLLGRNSDIDARRASLFQQQNELAKQMYNQLYQNDPNNVAAQARMADAQARLMNAGAYQQNANTNQNQGQQKIQFGYDQLAQAGQIAQQNFAQQAAELAQKRASGQITREGYANAMQIAQMNNATQQAQIQQQYAASANSLLGSTYGSTLSYNGMLQKAQMDQQADLLGKAGQMQQNNQTGKMVPAYSDQFAAAAGLPRPQPQVAAPNPFMQAIQQAVGQYFGGAPATAAQQPQSAVQQNPTVTLPNGNVVPLSAIQQIPGAPTPEAAWAWMQRRGQQQQYVQP